MVYNITTIEQLMNSINDRIKTVNKVIVEIESEGWMDGEKYSDETEYEKDLSYYEGKLDELQSMLNQISEPKESHLKLDYDKEGSGIVSFTFCYKLDNETKTDVTYKYYVEDSYCNEEMATFTKKEIKEQLKRNHKNDEGKLNYVIEMLITNSIN